MGECLSAGYRSDRDQLAELVNAHAAAVVPGMGEAGPGHQPVISWPAPRLRDHSRAQLAARRRQRGKPGRRRALAPQGQKCSGVFRKLISRVWA